MTDYTQHPRLKRGSVYFIECGDFIKIGHTIYVDLRFRSIRGIIPYDIKLLAVTCGTKKLEAKLHKQFAHLRHRNEWFRKAPELLELIEQFQPRVERRVNVVVGNIEIDQDNQLILQG